MRGRGAACIYLIPSTSHFESIRFGNNQSNHRQSRKLYSSTYKLFWILHSIHRCLFACFHHLVY